MGEEGQKAQTSKTSKKKKKKAQTSNYKLSKSQGCNVQHGD